MPGKSVSPRILLLLAIGALVLPIAITLMLGLGRLLGAMGDAAGSQVLDYLGLAGGLLWVFDLVSLLLALAARAIGEQSDSEE